MSDNYRTDWDGIYRRVEQKPWEKDDIEPALIDFFGNPSNKEKYKDSRIIDVGCGNGRLCKYLSDLGYKRVFGLDVSEYKKNDFDRNTEGRIQYICKDIVNDDISDFTYEENRFDIVICWFLLHHIFPEDVNKFIINLFNICQTNGLLILSFRLPTNENRQIDSHFSNEHKVQLYDINEVEKKIAPFFDVFTGEDKDLLNEPDIYGDVYPYYVMKMIKTKKTLLSGKINAFKERYIFSNRVDNSSDNSQPVELIALLNVLNEFYATSKTAEDLSETDYVDLFKSLFRNVSRIICKWLRNKGLGDNDAVILKMDTNTTVYSVSKYGDDFRPHCKFNKEKNSRVKSRAYELFYKYKDFLNHSTLGDENKITIIDYFSKHPDAKLIEYWLEDDSENQIQQLARPKKNCLDLNQYREFKSFLMALFFDSSVTSINYHVNHDVFNTFKDYLCTVGVKSRDLAKSFSAFNLGIPGFESWGVLIIEGVDSDYVTVNKWFYNNKKETKLLRDIKNVFFILQKIDYDYNESINKKKIKLEAVKSAKAAIMSRNMSHNLGSHVMSYLKQQLSSATSISKGQVLANLIPDGVNYNSDQIEKIGLPFLVGLGRFIGYLQERQDYIATISTDHVPYGVPVNLKDAIYDELNPDLRFLRHIKDPDENAKKRPANILLNYIAKSEGLSRENMNEAFQSNKDIRFGFIAYNNNGFEIFGLDGDEGKNQIVFASNNEALTQMRKINFSLPGGLVGRQAIFSIIENLIRNAAKHGNTSYVKNLDFTLDIIDGSMIRKEKRNEEKVIGWKEGKRIQESVWRKLYEKADDLDDIFLLTITDNLIYDDEIIVKLKKGLYEEFVDSVTGQMTTANKGIKEVRISAAWIRNETDESRYLKYPTVKYDNNKEELLPIGAEFIDLDPNNTAKKLAPLVAVEKSAEGHLRYIIGIPKNKTVAIVSEVKKEDGTLVAAFNRNALKEFNILHEQNRDRWTVLTDKELKNSKTSYSFILCPDKDDAFNLLRPFTSNRLCRWKVDKESKKVLESKDKNDEVLLYIYRHFTKLNYKSEDIFIDDYSELEPKYYKIRTDPQTITKGQPAYLYRTHLDSLKGYVDFVKLNENYNCFACAEGITGDNSSDRLIRREPLDERWYYTHLYALKKKIAIIDERIFKMVHGVEEKSFIGYSKEPIGVHELQSLIDKGKLELSAIKKLLIDKVELSGIQKALIHKAQSIEEISRIIETVPADIFASFLEIKTTDVDVLGHTYTTPFFKGKCIDVFTMIEDADEEMALVGCIDASQEMEGDNVVFNNTFTKIATLKDPSIKTDCFLFADDRYKAMFSDKYDFISIHQGILDKIYEKLGIKHKDNMAASENDVDKMKLEVTKSLYCHLMHNPSPDGDYLPNFIIHSGRAKPSEEDMPQKQPFVQFSAIESAIKDCKPMLVDLLDYAKYESN